MSIFLIFVFEDFLYNLSSLNEFNLQLINSLLIKKWCKCLYKHFNKYFVFVILNIIKQNAKIEYIDSQVFRIDVNHTFANEASNILIVDVNK